MNSRMRWICTTTNSRTRNCWKWGQGLKWWESQRNVSRVAPKWLPGHGNGGRKFRLDGGTFCKISIRTVWWHPNSLFSPGAKKRLKRCGRSWRNKRTMYHDQWNSILKVLSPNPQYLVHWNLEERFDQPMAKIIGLNKMLEFDCKSNNKMITL